MLENQYESMCEWLSDIESVSKDQYLYTEFQKQSYRKPLTEKYEHQYEVLDTDSDLLRWLHIITELVNKYKVFVISDETYKRVVYDGFEQASLVTIYGFEDYILAFFVDFVLFVVNCNRHDLLSCN